MIKESVRSGPQSGGTCSPPIFPRIFRAIVRIAEQSGRLVISVRVRDKLDRAQLFLRSAKSIAAPIYARHVWDYGSLPSSSFFRPRRLFEWKNLFRETRISGGSARGKSTVSKWNGDKLRGTR